MIPSIHPKSRKPHTAVIPSLRLDYNREQQAAWMQRHEECVARSRAGNVGLLFLGDSITEGWLTHGRTEWDRYFAPQNAANYGISGDRTQQVLWRVENGALDGISPQAVIVLIGTNNTTIGLGTDNPTPRNTPEEITGGIQAIVEAVQSRLPQSRIILFGIFPRGAKNDPLRGEIAVINRTLQNFETTHAVRFCDMGADFLAPDGSIPVEIMPDLLHPRAPGYKLWAKRLLPLLDEAGTQMD